MKYAILYLDHIYHGEDPGHGYPAWTEDVQRCVQFLNEDGLKGWIKRNNGRKQFIPIRYEELQVKQETIITLK